MKYIFENELILGKIIKKNSPYTVLVEIYGDQYSCYYPSKEKRKLKDVLCLLSVRQDLKRRTPFCVEAIQEKENWLCINETLEEEFFEMYMQERKYSKKAMLGPFKMDYAYDSTYIEILHNPKEEIFVEHVKDLLTVLQPNQKIHFVSFQPFHFQFNQNQKYWIEEGIDRGMEFIHIPIVLTPSYIENLDVINETEKYL